MVMARNVSWYGSQIDLAPSLIFTTEEERRIEALLLIDKSSRISFGECRSA